MLSCWLGMRKIKGGNIKILGELDGVKKAMDGLVRRIIVKFAKWLDILFLILLIQNMIRKYDPVQTRDSY